MTAVSASTRSAQSKLSAPLSTHLSTGVTVVSAPPLTKSRKIGQLSTADRNSAPVVSDLATTLPSMRLPRPATMAASKGPKTMIRIGCKRSAFHPVDVVDRDRAAGAEVDDEDREPDRRLAGGNGEHEHREDLAGQVAEEGAEGDEVDVHREQDQLDRHQDDDHVLAVEEDAEHAEHEQDRADDDVVFDADHAAPPKPGAVRGELVEPRPSTSSGRTDLGELAPITA